MLNCTTVKQYLSRYYDGECENDIEKQIADFLNTSKKCRDCGTCSELLADYGYIRSALSKLPEYGPSAGYRTAFARKLAACTSASGKADTTVVYPLFKKKRTIFASLTAAAMIVFAIGALWFTTPNVQQGIGSPVVTYIQGKAYIADNEVDQPRMLTMRHPIAPGATIATGPVSKVDIVLKDKFKISLKENSVLTIEELTSEADRLKVICRLQRGGVLADVDKYENASDFRILTELVNVAVKGTQFSVETDDSDNSKKVTVAVFEGAVEVKKSYENATDSTDNQPYLVRENHKMTFADDTSAVVSRQLSSDDVEAFWEVYEIGNRKAEINYQATPTDNKGEHRSQSQ